jgi:hemerythrin-like domain-containing protein
MITEFLERYQDLCVDYSLEEKEMTRRLPRYCDVVIEQYVKAMTAEENNWKSLCKVLRRDYRDKDLSQQVHSISYLEAFKDKQRTRLEEVPPYCRQFSAKTQSRVSQSDNFQRFS